MVLAASNHFASFFLGLELLSVSLYALIAYRRGDVLGIEAGVKYLVLAAVSSAFLLFGMALVYAEPGTMEFSPRWPTHGRHGPAHGVFGAGRAGDDRRGHRLQAGAGALPPVDARRVPRRPGPGDGLHRHRLQGRRVRPAAAVLHAGWTWMAYAVAADRLRAHRRRLHVRRQPAGPAAGQRQADPGLLLHRPPGLPAGGLPGRRGPLAAHGGRRSTWWPTSSRRWGPSASSPCSPAPVRDADDAGGLPRPGLAAALAGGRADADAALAGGHSADRAASWASSTSWPPACRPACGRWWWSWSSTAPSACSTTCGSSSPSTTRPRSPPGRTPCRWPPRRGAGRRAGAAAGVPGTGLAGGLSLHDDPRHPGGHSGTVLV